MPDSEFASLLKPWIAKPYDQLSPEIQTIVWEQLPQRRDTRFLLPPRRFVSVWDDLDENDRLKAAQNTEAAFELGFRKPPDIDAQMIDIYAWAISRFGIAGKNGSQLELANDGGEGPIPEISASLSPMELAAYAATQNPWLVARCAPDGPGCKLNRLEFDAIHSQSLSPTRVLEKAVDMLRAGKIVMTALRDGVRREMPAEDWRYWTFRTSPIDMNSLAVCDVATREPVAGWTNLLISREHVDLVRAALLGRETPERPTVPVGVDAQPVEAQKLTRRPRKNRKTNGRDYRELDKPYVDKMHDMIVRSPGMSPEAAAKKFVSDAPGNSIESSKIARLAKRYRAIHPDEKKD